MWRLWLCVVACRSPAPARSPPAPPVPDVDEPDRCSELPASCFGTIGIDGCPDADPVVIELALESQMIPALVDVRLARIAQELRRTPHLELVVEGSVAPAESPALALARANAIAVELMRYGAGAYQVHLVRGREHAARVRLTCVGDDTDDDGVFDRDDKCPLDQETFNSVDDDDGCPDSPPRRH